MSPQSVAPRELSLAQTWRKSDGIPAFAPQQMQPKSLIGGDFLRALNGLVENAIIMRPFAPGIGRPAKQTSGGDDQRGRT
jgi:hypothetical protein